MIVRKCKGGKRYKGGRGGDGLPTLLDITERIERCRKGRWGGRSDVKKNGADWNAAGPGGVFGAWARRRQHAVMIRLHVIA